MPKIPPKRAKAPEKTAPAEDVFAKHAAAVQSITIPAPNKPLMPAGSGAPSPRPAAPQGPAPVPAGGQSPPAAPRPTRVNIPDVKPQDVPPTVPKQTGEAGMTKGMKAPIININFAPGNNPSVNQG
jgi:hypothetical protein